MTISFSGEELVLAKERAIYWHRKRMLIISDLHIGKSAHFRKHGIQVPSTIGADDLERLSKLISLHTPEILLITGDLFHNHLNSDVAEFAAWRKTFPALKFILIKGNHDRLKKEDYQSLDIEVHDRELICAPFRFIHDQPEQVDEYYPISGHIHPGVTVYGKARQRLNLPCFYFGEKYAVLPAFSGFTGLSRIKPEQNGRFYAISPTKVIAV